MAQQTKGLAAKTDNLGSIPRTHMVKENVTPASGPLNSVHTHTQLID